MSVIAKTYRCDWPYCPATVTIDPHQLSGLHDADWEHRGSWAAYRDSQWHACRVHRFKSEEEFREAIERDRERGEYLG